MFKFNEFWKNGKISKKALVLLKVCHQICFQNAKNSFKRLKDKEIIFIIIRKTK